MDQVKKIKTIIDIETELKTIEDKINIFNGQIDSKENDEKQLRDGFAETQEEVQIFVNRSTLRILEEQRNQNKQIEINENILKQSPSLKAKSRAEEVIVQAKQNLTLLTEKITSIQGLQFDFHNTSELYRNKIQQIQNNRSKKIQDLPDSFEEQLTTTKEKINKFKGKYSKSIEAELNLGNPQYADSSTGQVKIQMYEDKLKIHENTVKFEFEKIEKAIEALKAQKSLQLLGLSSSLDAEFAEAQKLYQNKISEIQQLRDMTPILNKEISRLNQALTGNSGSLSRLLDTRFSSPEGSKERKESEEAILKKTKELQDLEKNLSDVCKKSPDSLKKHAQVLLDKASEIITQSKLGGMHSTIDQLNEKINTLNNRIIEKDAKSLTVEELKVYAAKLKENLEENKKNISENKDVLSSLTKEAKENFSNEIASMQRVEASFADTRLLYENKLQEIHLLIIIKQLQADTDGLDYFLNKKEGLMGQLPSEEKTEELKTIEKNIDTLVAKTSQAQFILEQADKTLPAEIKAIADSAVKRSSAVLSQKKILEPGVNDLNSKKEYNTGWDIDPVGTTNASAKASEAGTEAKQESKTLATKAKNFVSTRIPWAKTAIIRQGAVKAEDQKQQLEEKNNDNFRPSMSRQS